RRSPRAHPSTFPLPARSSARPARSPAGPPRRRAVPRTRALPASIELLADVEQQPDVERVLDVLPGDALRLGGVLAPERLDERLVLRQRLLRAARVGQGGLRRAPQRGVDLLHEADQREVVGRPQYDLVEA